MLRIPLTALAALLLAQPAWAQQDRLGGHVVPDPWAVERIVLPEPPEPAPVVRELPPTLRGDGRHPYARRDQLPPVERERRQMFRLLEEAMPRRERQRRRDDDDEGEDD